MERTSIETDFRIAMQRMGLVIPINTDAVIEIDSLERVQLCMDVENYFEINITDDELVLLSTIYNWVNLIEKKVNTHHINKQSMEKISLNGELIITLHNKKDWVKRIPHALPNKRPGEDFLFVDKDGNVFECGADFQAAEDYNKYPCKVYRLLPVRFAIATS